MWIFLQAKDRKVRGEFQPSLEVYDYIMIGLSLAFIAVYVVWMLVQKTIALPELLHLSLLITLFFSLLCYCLATVPAGNDLIGCKILAAINQFFFLSFTFWKNSLAISITRTVFIFTNSRTSKKEYTWYAVYALGVPLLLVLITYGLSVEEENIAAFTSPVYRTEFLCFLQESIVLYSLFLSPMYFLITVNIILCIVSMRKIIKTGGLARKNDKTRAYRNAVTCIKLSVSLGLGWPLLLLYVFDTSLWPIAQAFVELQGVFVVLSYLIRWKCLTNIKEKMTLTSKTHSASAATSSHPTELTQMT